MKTKAIPVLVLFLPLAVSFAQSAVDKKEIQTCVEGIEIFENDLAKTQVNTRFAVWLREQCSLLRQQCGSIEKACCDKASRGARDACIEAQAQAVRGRLERFRALLRFQDTAREAGCPESFGVGIATAMNKVLPRALDLPITAGNRVSLAAARGEKESFQIVVIPWNTPLEAVTVTLGDIHDSAGNTLPSSAMSVSAVGYLKTEKPSRYNVAHVGWWPDPLLDFLTTVEVAQGDAQAFWVRIAVPDDQPAGQYRGQAVVSAANVPDYNVEVEMRIYDFRLPAAPPLRTAFTVTDHPGRYGDWETLRFQYADLLADYYIDFDDSYRRVPADPAMVEYLLKKGVLSAYNLAHIHKSEFLPDMEDADFTRALKTVEERIRPAYEDAKRLGVLDKAYIYGFDERGKDYFPVLQRVGAYLDTVFPGVPFLSTTYDHSFGLDSGIIAVDGWIPLTPRYDPEKAAAARARGREVWWYICCGPIHPYANFFIEYDAIEARLLMGAMTAKYRPDGFLYYKVTRWPNKQDPPITDGPFLDWDPASYRDYNGDGSLLCPGPGGRPLPTVRLENIRDGLEDYAYVRMLEARMATVRKKDPGNNTWLREAETALKVPRGVVENLREYTRDASVLYSWRTHLAEVIEAAPMD